MENRQLQTNQTTQSNYNTLTPHSSLLNLYIQVTGKFFTGDSYILLSTTKSKSGALSWNIHFWLGNETTHDEAGTAAYKSVELDDALGGAAVQFREVQGNESTQFLSYFKATGGVSYEPGGAQSGFRHGEGRIHYKTAPSEGKENVKF